MEAEREWVWGGGGGCRGTLGRRAAGCFKGPTGKDSLPFEHVWLSLALPSVLMFADLSTRPTSSPPLSTHVELSSVPPSQTAEGRPTVLGTSVTPSS